MLNVFSFEKGQLSYVILDVVLFKFILNCFIACFEPCQLFPHIIYISIMYDKHIWYRKKIIIFLNCVVILPLVIIYKVLLNRDFSKPDVYFLSRYVNNKLCWI